MTQECERPWQDLGYEVLVTRDGSPSLAKKLDTRHPSESGTSLGDTQPRGEAMHHLGGAFSETLLIYGTPLERAFKVGARSVGSVGLGLGYNEVLVAALATCRGLRHIHLQSWESDSNLVQVFHQALVGMAGSVDSTFGANAATPQKSCSEILQRFASHFPSQPGDDGGEFLARWLVQAKQSGSWQVLGDLLGSPSEQPLEVVLFDAFSSRSQPELWNESFLQSWLEASCAPDCVFSTYACTSALKRVFRRSSWTIHPRPGAFGKKESFLASRGAFRDLFGENGKVGE